MAVPAFLGARAAAADEAPVFDFDPARGVAAGCPDFAGLVVVPDFVSEPEARRLLGAIGSDPFVPSQSGKWKQHHGARINFMKRKVNASRFRGLPGWAHAIEARLAARRDDLLARAACGDRERLAAALDAFRMMDVFVLRYRESAASNLDFHVDDLHAYGELILDLSLESASVLSFLHPADAPPDSPGLRCVRATLPPRSLALLYGPARHAWSHAILPGDVRGQRTSITLRTLSEAVRRSPEGEAVMRRIRERARGAVEPGFGGR